MRLIREMEMIHSSIIFIDTPTDKIVFFEEFELLRHIRLATITSSEKGPRSVYSGGYEIEDCIRLHGQSDGRKYEISRVFEERHESEEFIDEGLFFSRHMNLTI